MGRVGEVTDTNAAIAFLADDSTGGFLTGILLPVDGKLSFSIYLNRPILKCSIFQAVAWWLGLNWKDREA